MTVNSFISGSGTGFVFFKAPDFSEGAKLDQYFAKKSDSDLFSGRIESGSGQSSSGSETSILCLRATL